MAALPPTLGIHNTDIRHPSEMAKWAGDVIDPAPLDAVTIISHCAFIKSIATHRHSTKPSFDRLYHVFPKHSADVCPRYF
jgi:hypothetical protein